MICRSSGAERGQGPTLSRWKPSHHLDSDSSIPILTGPDITRAVRKRNHLPLSSFSELRDRPSRSRGSVLSLRGSVKDERALRSGGFVTSCVFGSALARVVHVGAALRRVCLSSRHTVYITSRRIRWKLRFSGL